MNFNFALAGFKTFKDNAKEIFDKMKENSIIIRNMGDYLRITAGNSQENEKMLETFKKVLEEV